MSNEHAPDCPATTAQERFDYVDWLSDGARELDAGGDDEAENCTCGVAVDA